MEFVQNEEMGIRSLLALLVTEEVQVLLTITIINVIVAEM